MAVQPSLLHPPPLRNVTEFTRAELSRAMDTKCNNPNMCFMAYYAIWRHYSDVSTVNGFYMHVGISTA